MEGSSYRDSTVFPQRSVVVAIGCHVKSDRSHPHFTKVDR